MLTETTRYRRRRSPGRPPARRSGAPAKPGRGRASPSKARNPLRRTPCKRSGRRSGCRATDRASGPPARRRGGWTSASGGERIGRRDGPFCRGPSGSPPNTGSTAERSTTCRGPMGSAEVGPLASGPIAAQTARALSPRRERLIGCRGRYDHAVAEVHEPDHRGSLAEDLLAQAGRKVAAPTRRERALAGRGGEPGPSCSRRQPAHRQDPVQPVDDPPQSDSFDLGVQVSARPRSASTPYRDPRARK